MEPITREQLQNLNAETARANMRKNVRQAVYTYYTQIKEFATTRTETRHFINTARLKNELVDAVVVDLRELFPRCMVEYHETRNVSNQVIESGIIVDWS
jgi:hypothetical protein